MKYIHRELKTTLSVLCETDEQADFVRSLSVESFVGLVASDNGEACEIVDFIWEQLAQFEEEVKGS